MSNLSNWEKFVLLSWKNWKLLMNRKIALLFELILPPLFVLLLVFVRLQVDPTKNEFKVYHPFPLQYLELSDTEAAFDFEMKVVYTPRNEILKSIVETAANKINMDVQSVPCVERMETEFINRKFFAGVVFDENLKNLKNINEIKKLSFTLRFPVKLRTVPHHDYTWLTGRLYPQYQVVGPRNIMRADGGVPSGYFIEGFLVLQNLLIRSYLEKIGGTLPHVYMQRYPYPEYEADNFVHGISNLIHFLILISYIYPCVNITRRITLEKEKELKEIMKAMGISNWIHWTAWFVQSFVLILISVVFMTVILKFRFKNHIAVLNYVHWGVLFIFLLIYGVASIFFCFLISTFFKKGRTAAAATGLILFIAYCPFAFLYDDYSYLSLEVKMVWCLVSNSALGFGLTVVIFYEYSGTELGFKELFEPINSDDNVSLGDVIIMMAASCFIYMIITLYNEQISPGEYGIPRKWYFPLTSGFWCGEDQFATFRNVESYSRVRPSSFEEEPIDKKPGVQMFDLKKKFGKKIVVRDVTLNLYEDDITVLLGHNGAGKTTVIAMLCGLYPATSGQIFINGINIETSFTEARNVLGICTQNNALFDDLTVSDHIVFFSRMKGLAKPAIQAEVQKYLRLIQLEKKANKRSATLSGGMKRKLCLCCALCAGSKVVLCDEPSSGLDPFARRQLWKLLQREKAGRTILLTTQYMDEADALGDRIAIMCNGEIKCYGSSFFLKKQYGSGYNLVCERGPDCDINDVTMLLKKYIPDIQIKSNIGAELTFVLPERYSAEFENMFRDLEENATRLHVHGYGICITTLEEVFMKIGAEAAADTAQNLVSLETGGSMINLFAEDFPLRTGIALVKNQWTAMFLKKFLYVRENWPIFLVLFVMPIFFVAVTIVIVRNTNEYSFRTPMTFDLKQYSSAVVVLDTTRDLEPAITPGSVQDFYKSNVESRGERYKLEIADKYFHNYILELGKTKQTAIDKEYLAAVSFTRRRIIAWFNNQLLHTAPLSLNLIYSAYAKAISGDPNAEIVVTNWPLPHSQNKPSADDLAVKLAIHLSFSMCFILATFILFVINERASGAKHLQFVSGVRLNTFWFSQYIFDFMFFSILCFLAIITLVCFQEQGFETFTSSARLLVLLVMFGMAALPFTYLISMFFQEPSSGFGVISFLNLIIGVAGFLMIMLLSLPMFGTKDTADTIKWVLLLYPHFSLAWGLLDLISNVRRRIFCDKISKYPKIVICERAPECCDLKDYFEWATPGILRELVFLLITTIICWLLIFLIEYGVFKKLLYRWKIRKIKPPALMPAKFLDDDVAAERDRIAAMTKKEIKRKNLVLDRVSKYYGKFRAVNQISLCVEKRECFGLLGVNGAGKTTTFKMMTGDTSITFGKVYVRGINLNKDVRKTYKKIGYCPQFDALLDDLTGREVMKIFCLLRGVPGYHIKSISEYLASCFGFLKYIDKKTKKISGGTKRKLSTAIACIGNPSIIYMDEPTCGIDPVARRHIWTMISHIRELGKSIVLTSHSMEECEALCTRMVVMVNGEFKCMGSTQHLKNKFSKGIIIKTKIKKSDDNADYTGRSYRRYNTTDYKNIIKDFVYNKFPNAMLKEEYESLLTFYIPFHNVKWSTIFGLMEANREALHIEDYAVSQTSLEEIFLDFAMVQKEDTRISL